MTTADEQTLTDLGMVCDAYGLPHSAVALARHLASNAQLDHDVNMDTIRVLEGRLNANGKVWLNAMMCVRPTDEFAAEVGRELIKQAMQDGEPKKEPLDPYRRLTIEVVVS